MRNLFMLLLMLCLSLAVFSCGGDDDDNDSGDDDTPVDDDTVDDDTSADDDDDTPDDDTPDDDTPDDDTIDDDTVPLDPYADMEPGGKTMDGIMGVSSHMHRGTSYSWKREFEIERLVEAGMTMVRNDFHWYVIEAEDDVWNFDGLDTMVDLCREAGLELTCIFLGAPDWAIPGGTHDEIDPDNYADYTGQTAAHFADRIDYYEFWNEQNTTRFWKPEPNPAKYGELLKVTYEAVHANDPDAHVIFGGLSPFEVHFFDPRGIWNFIYRVHEEHEDICDYFDVVSIHPYTFLQQPSPEFYLDLGIYVYPDTAGFVDLLRKTLADIGCPDKPIQFTEMGWPSLLINDRRQATYLARSAMIGLAKGIEFYDWYTFWDGSGSASLPTEDYFGLFTYPQDEQTDAKLSYLALLGMHDLIGNAQYAGDLREALGWDGDVYAYVFADDADIWTVGIWRGGMWLEGEATVTVPLSQTASGDWWLYDQEGNLLDSGETSEGIVEVTVSGFVQYLQFSNVP